MTDERVERRLAAVLAADVAGYSRLMGRNEERTLAGLKTFRKTIVDPTIAAHRGRIAKTTGDGMLFEFASAVDAARCAVEIQRGTAGQNADIAKDIRIEFRIGIHVGDIIIDDNDFFGDGVNLAARLEGIAEPGGVCISDDAQRQILRQNIAFDDMGLQNLKNIAEPMRAWRLRFDAGSASSIASTKRPAETSQPLALPDKPSIAVPKPTKESTEEALRLFSRVIELDSNFAAPYAAATRCYSARKAYGWVTDPAVETVETSRLIQRAVKLGTDDALRARLERISDFLCSWRCGGWRCADGASALSLSGAEQA